MDHLCLPASLLIALVAAAVMLPRIILVAYRKRLFDTPDARKIHINTIPRLGGTCFFPIVLLAVSLVVGYLYRSGIRLGEDIEMEALFLTSGIMPLFAIGLADDLMGVRSRTKLLVQACCAGFFPVSGLYINNLYGLFGIWALPPAAGIVLTILTVVFITNAVNLIDGLDGLASGIALTAAILFSVFFCNEGRWMYAILSMSLTGVLISFFYFNVFGIRKRGEKIFMGDTGSLTLGYLLSFLVVKYSMFTPERPEVLPVPALVAAISTLSIPLLDVVRVVILRLRIGGGIFSPDKNHIHHKLLRTGCSSHASMLIIIVLNAVFCVLNLSLAPYVNINCLLLVDVAVWMALNLFLDGVLRFRNGDNGGKNS
jgi:UDP-N-acetylmuramyl pentapeptide phosphotransferase/UDP-N-acetylglucosamine-1-phosphate transferase